MVLYIKNHLHSFWYYRVLHVMALLAAGAFLYLMQHSQVYGQASVVNLLSVSLGVLLLSLIVCIYYYRKKIRLPLGYIILWACIFRLVGLYSYPILEDDHFRFLWDAYQSATTGSPYNKAPAEYFDQDNIPDVFDEVLNGINYPDIPTIYAPVTQGVFVLAYYIKPASVYALKSVLLLFDIGLLLLLAYFVSTVGNKLQRAAFLLYAWSPLIIKEIAFTAHPDIIGVFFLFAAIILYYKYDKYRVFVAVLCALAVASKVFAIVLVPLLLKFNWRLWSVFFVSLLLVCLPFLSDLLSMVASIKTMGEHWLFNAPLYFSFNLLWEYGFSTRSIEQYSRAITVFKLLCLMAFTLLWLIEFIKYSTLEKQQAVRIIPRGDYLYGVFLLAIPVVNPWYLLWLLPFAVITPSLWAWVASISVLLSYIIGLNIESPNLAAYQQPYWALMVEYGLILIAVVLPYLYMESLNKPDNLA